MSLGFFSRSILRHHLRFEETTRGTLGKLWVPAGKWGHQVLPSQPCFSPSPLSDTAPQRGPHAFPAWVTCLPSVACEWPGYHGEVSLTAAGTLSCVLLKSYFMKHVDAALQKENLAFCGALQSPLRKLIAPSKAARHPAKWASRTSRLCFRPPATHSTSGSF